MKPARYVMLFFSLAVFGFAQTIQVDITPSHVRKSLVPNQALGAGIDRIAVQMIDQTFVKPVIDRVLEAGWGPVTYRQNTELYTEAWHWNSRGKWSDPEGKGYFVGDSNPSTDRVCLPPGAMGAQQVKTRTQSPRYSLREAVPPAGIC